MLKLYTTIQIVILFVITVQCQEELNVSFFPSFGLCPEMRDKVSLVHPNNYWEIYVIKNGKVQYPFNMEDSKGVEVDKLDSLASMVPDFSQISKFRIWDGNDDEYQFQGHNVRIQNLGQDEHSSQILSSKQIYDLYNYNERLEDSEKNQSQYFYVNWSDKKQNDKGLKPHMYAIFIKDKQGNPPEEISFFINKKYANLKHNSNFQVVLEDIEIINPITQSNDEPIVLQGDQMEKVQVLKNDLMQITFQVKEGSQIVQNVSIQQDGEQLMNFNDFVLHQFNSEYIEIAMLCSKQNIEKKDILNTIISIDLKDYETHTLTIQKFCANEDPEEIFEEDIIKNVINKIDNSIQEENQNSDNYEQQEESSELQDNNNDNSDDDEEVRKQKIKNWKDHPANQTIKNQHKKEKLQKIDNPKSVLQNLSIQSNLAKKQKAQQFDIVNKGKVLQMYSYDKIQKNKAIQSYSENTDVVDFWAFNNNPSKNTKNVILLKPSINIINKSKDFKDQEIAKPQVTTFGKKNPKINKLYKEGYIHLNQKGFQRIQVKFNCLKEGDIIVNVTLRARYSQDDYDEIINLYFQKRCTIDGDEEVYVENTFQDYQPGQEQTTLYNILYCVLCIISLFFGCKLISCFKRMIKADSEISQQQDLENMKRKYDQMDQLPDSSVVFRN